MVASKTALLLFPVVPQQYQNKVSFQRKDFGIILNFSLHFLKDRKCSPMNRQHLLPFKRFSKNFDTALEPFL